MLNALIIPTVPATRHPSMAKPTIVSGLEFGAALGWVDASGSVFMGYNRSSWNAAVRGEKRVSGDRRLILRDHAIEAVKVLIGGLVSEIKVARHCLGGGSHV